MKSLPPKTKGARVRRAALASAALLVAVPLLANHGWNDYHWSSGGGELTVPVGDNVSSVWDSYLRVAVYGDAAAQKPGWNKSAHIEGEVVAGMTNPKSCRPVAGRIEVCSGAYGQTGWLGVAQIWLSGNHISQGITKLNDTYFSTARYNSPAWRRLVTCQEVGHDYGLGHTDEEFANYNHGTCMDYTNAPAGKVVNGFDYGPSNEYPNQHDFDQLSAIYSHSHSALAASAGQPGRSEEAGGNSPGDWGRPIDFLADGRPHVFEKVIGPGRRMITHVFWAEGEGPRGSAH